MEAREGGHVLQRLLEYAARRGEGGVSWWCPPPSEMNARVVGLVIPLFEQELDLARTQATGVVGVEV